MHNYCDGINNHGLLHFPQCNSYFPFNRKTFNFQLPSSLCTAGSHVSSPPWALLKCSFLHLDLPSTSPVTPLTHSGSLFLCRPSIISGAPTSSAALWSQLADGYNSDCISYTCTFLVPCLFLHAQTFFASALYHLHPPPPPPAL